MIFSKKGLTLLEILVAVTIFSVMMVFLTQIVQMSFRHKNKISGDVQFQREHSNILEVISQDFKGMTTFFDFNKNLQILYPLKKDDEEREEAFFDEVQNPLAFLFNPEFEFLGKDQEIKFVTFSFVESFGGDEMAYQLIKVHYFLRECKNLKTDEKTQCLFRSLVHLRDNDEVKINYVLLRGVQSLKFSYYDKEEKEWMKDWENSQSDFPSSKWLPSEVKMDIEWENQKRDKKSYTFSLSYPLLRNQKNQLRQIMHLALQGDILKKEKEYEKFLKERIKKEQLNKLEKPPTENQQLKNLLKVQKEALDSIHKSGVNPTDNPLQNNNKEAQ